MKHVVSFSGGKDSTAMLLRMIELDYQIDDIFFADTGFEFQELYDYIEKIERYIGRKINFLTPKKDFFEFAQGKIVRGKYKGKIRGFPYILTPCWWTREAKIVPIQKYIDKNTISYVGIAYDEQNRIRDDENIKYPLNDWKWTEKDCVDYLNKKGLFNPLYVNFNRLGCWMCPKQNLTSLYIIYKLYPKYWDKMKEFDKWNLENTGRNIYQKPLIELEVDYKKGKLPKNNSKYECWNGCEGVKKAFDCGLFDY